MEQNLIILNQNEFGILAHYNRSRYPNMRVMIYEARLIFGLRKKLKRINLESLAIKMMNTILLFVAKF